jgi:glycosyltransferase involved in cell wall biosynthesis
MEGGGAERVLIDLLSRFDTNKYNVDLCIIHERGYLLKDIPANINLLHYKHFPRWIWLEEICYRHLWLYPFYYICEAVAFRLFIKVKYDAIVSFLEGLSLRYHSFVFKKSNNNISWVHCNIYHEWYLHLAKWYKGYFNSKKHEEYLYNQLASIVFVSEDSRKGFNRTFNAPHPQQMVIHNFLVNKEEIQSKANEYEVEKSKFTICCVGRFSQQKRFDKAINIAKILKDKGLEFELWMLGEGNLEKEYKQQIKELNLRDNIVFFGYQRNPYPYIRKADIFLLTSDVEGGPLVVCEALCLNVPVVSTDVGYVKEVLNNGKYGVVTSFEEKDIADTLIDLMKDKEKLQCYVNKISQEFHLPDREQTMSQIYALLDK